MTDQLSSMISSVIFKIYSPHFGKHPTSVTPLCEFPLDVHPTLRISIYNFVYNFTQSFQQRTHTPLMTKQPTLEAHFGRLCCSFNGQSLLMELGLRNICIIYLFLQIQLYAPVPLPDNYKLIQSGPNFTLFIPHIICGNSIDILFPLKFTENSEKCIHCEVLANVKLTAYSFITKTQVSQKFCQNFSCTIDTKTQFVNFQIYYNGIHC